MSDVRHEPLSMRASRLFREMADAVDLNGGAFSGAFVIVGPDGQVKKMLLVNDEPEAAMFWSNAEMMCKMAISQAEQDQPMNPRQRPPGW